MLDAEPTIAALTAAIDETHQAMSAVLSPVQEREPLRLAVVEGPPPVTRGDCESGPRPCPWACRYRLDVSERESCALDVADGGPSTFAEIAELLGLPLNHVQKLAERALQRLGPKVRSMGLRLEGHEVSRAVEPEPLRIASGRTRRPSVPVAPSAMRIAREKIGLSLRSVAAQVGVTPVALSRYERGESRLTDDVEERLAGLLGVELGKLG